MKMRDELPRRDEWLRRTGLPKRRGRKKLRRRLKGSKRSLRNLTLSARREMKKLQRLID